MEPAILLLIGAVLIIVGAKKGNTAALVIGVVLAFIGLAQFIPGLGSAISELAQGILNVLIDFAKRVLPQQ